jgi:RNA polymerase sigma-54 factor
VDLLQKDGIEIARRTVAKYREQLRIPSSVQRRREKLSASA